MPRLSDLLADSSVLEKSSKTVVKAAERKRTVKNCGFSDSLEVEKWLEADLDFNDDDFTREALGCNREGKELIGLA